MGIGKSSVQPLALPFSKPSPKYSDGPKVFEPFFHALRNATPFKQQATHAVVSEAAALHPLTYLPFHLIGHHLTARLFPSRSITYPLHLVFALAQYAVEHYNEEFPSVAAMSPLLVAIGLSLAPYSYYRALKVTEGPKWLIWLALGTFLFVVPFFKHNELGFPKDTPAEQAVANKDYTYSMWHLCIHCIGLVTQLMVAYGVPWEQKVKSA